MRHVFSMSTRPLLGLAVALAVTGCAMRDANLAPGSGAPSYAPANAAPPELSAAANELAGPVWQWQRTHWPDGKSVAATGPDRYTLKFEGGGRVLLRADCNRGSASYEVSGSAMKLGPAMLTRMGCPPGSQDAEFASAVAGVASYAIGNSELTLTLAGGATMRFRAQ